MASEYLKQKYKDVKPDKKVELTLEQKRRNWWDYHKGWVLLGVVLAVAIGLLIRDIFFRPVPDYQVGYVSKTPLPAKVKDSLQTQLETFGEDVNGDGRVLVEIFTYTLDFGEQGMMDAEAATAGITSLTVDLFQGRVCLLLLDDPKGFQARMGALAYLDGGTPPLDDPSYGSDGWQEMVYAWEDCPILAGLNLGTYIQFFDIEEREIDGQAAMKGIYVGRRILFDEEQQTAFAADTRLWQALTSGAEALDDQGAGK